MDGRSAVGGGTTPGPRTAVAGHRAAPPDGREPTGWTPGCGSAEMPVVGRIERDRLLLDLQDRPPREDDELASALEAIPA